MIKRLWLVVAILCCVATVQAQDRDFDQGGRAVSFYRYVDAGEPAMHVNVWGDVRMPGRYEVREGTPLIDLVFLAGAPTERALQYRERRKTVLRVSRREATGWRVVYEVTLDDATTSESAIPDLKDEDIVKVETTISQRVDWREALQIFGTLASLALLSDRLFNR